MNVMVIKVLMMMNDDYHDCDDDNYDSDDDDDNGDYDQEGARQRV